jgi:translation elongation factor EF-4
MQREGKKKMRQFGKADIPQQASITALPKCSFAAQERGFRFGI